MVKTRLTLSSDLGVDARQFDKDDVPKGLLSVVRDPDSSDVGSIVENNILVVLGVSLCCFSDSAGSMRVKGRLWGVERMLRSLDR